MRGTEQNIICCPYPQDHYLGKNTKGKYVVLNSDHLQVSETGACSIPCLCTTDKTKLQSSSNLGIPLPAAVSGG